MQILQGKLANLAMRFAHSDRYLLNIKQCAHYINLLLVTTCPGHFVGKVEGSFIGFLMFNPLIT